MESAGRPLRYATMENDVYEMAVVTCDARSGFGGDSALLRVSR